MSKQQQGVWGIDLGQCALKAVRLEIVGGAVAATAFDYVEHPKILSQPDADPDQLSREALLKFLSRNHLGNDIICISVPGQSGLARFVKLPPVEEKKIGDIVQFEAKQQIPFPLEEVVWAYQKIGSGVVTDGFAMETEIGLFAIKRDMVNRYLQHFMDVKVEVHIVQMAPLALCNYLSYDLLNKGGPPEPPAKDGEKGENKEEKKEEKKPGEPKRCVVGLDIGADSSSLVITDGERIIWQRPIPFGGNHFTRALSKDLKLTFAKAEHLKRNATKSPDLRKILAALKPVLNDFAGEIQRSLGYFTNTHRDAHIEYMVGLGSAFRLPGLQKFLSEKLQLEIRKLQKLERLGGEAVITAPAFTENVLSFAVAYGLALQGLGLPRVQTNLLPQEIHFARLIKAKKPWAAVAAAALLLGIGAQMLGYAWQHRAVAASPIPEDIQASQKILNEVADWKGKCDRMDKEIKANEIAVKSVISGQDEMLNWLKLNQFVNDCLPRPDGTDLQPQPLSYYDDGVVESIGTDKDKKAKKEPDKDKKVADKDNAEFTVASKEGGTYKYKFDPDGKFFTVERFLSDDNLVAVKELADLDKDTWFGLSEHSLEKLLDEKVSKEVVAKMNNKDLIDQKYTTEKDFLDRLKKSKLTDDEVTKNKAKILAEARHGTRVRLHFNYVGGKVESVADLGKKRVFVVVGGDGKRYTCKLDPQAQILEADGKPGSLAGLKKDQEVYFQPLYVNPEAAKEYLTAAAGEAYQNWWKRQALPKDENQVILDAGLSALLEVNLEAVNPRYCTDLAKYAQALKEKGKKPLREVDQKEALKGPGWVVELRGYTYHYDQGIFLNRTLVWKLATFKHRDQDVEVKTLYLKRPKDAPADQPHGNDPMQGKVSHALLWDRKALYSPSNWGELVNGGVVADLVGGAKGGDKGGQDLGAMAGGAKGAGGGGGGGSWTPLGNTGSGRAGGNAGAPGGVGRREVPGAGQVGLPVGRDGQREPPKEETKPGQGPTVRTEFIVLFVWKEPTPSDLLGTHDAGKPGPGQLKLGGSGSGNPLINPVTSGK
jgi:type IV pilus assembly protein PilM